MSRAAALVEHTLGGQRNDPDDQHRAEAETQALRATRDWRNAWESGRRALNGAVRAEGRSHGHLAVFFP